MNSTPEYRWSTPLPPPRMAVVIPFPDRRRQLGEQAVTRALVEARERESFEQFKSRVVNAAVILAGLGALVALEVWLSQ